LDSFRNSYPVGEDQLILDR